MVAGSFHFELISLFQVVAIDLVLAGDNAIVVGMVACGVAAEQRRKVICMGIFAAVLLRIVFAVVTTELLEVIGLTLAGGLLLLWVCWKLYRELQEQRAEDAAISLFDGSPENVDCSAGVAVGPEGATIAAAMPRKSVRQAVFQVALADLSMSLDNVLAVAGAARDHVTSLVLGLALSVVLMGIGAALIAGLLQRYRWLGYLGLALIAFVACRMIVDGTMEVGSAMAGVTGL